MYELCRTIEKSSTGANMDERTHIDHLLVVPVSVVVNDSVMTMSSIHLTSIRAHLIGFWPIMLGSLPVEMPDAYRVGWSKGNLALFYVVLDMAFGNDAAHAFHEVRHVGETLSSS